jgi:HSP20 family molecular chaperone IbpA
VWVDVEDTHPKYTISLAVAGISPKEEDANVYYIVKGT